MDFLGPIFLCLIIFLCCISCTWCCKRKRPGIIYGFRNANPNVTVTEAPYPGPTTCTNGAYPPYPVQQPAPMPQPQPGIGFQTPAPGYPVAPTHAPIGGYPPASGPPYPPVVGPTYQQQPPSYSEAVAHPPMTSEAYAKQSPYNPNY